jgi:hypothetical protein
MTSCQQQQALLAPLLTWLCPGLQVYKLKATITELEKQIAALVEDRDAQAQRAGHAEEQWMQVDGARAMLRDEVDLLKEQLEQATWLT